MQRYILFLIFLSFLTLYNAVSLADYNQEVENAKTVLNDALNIISQENTNVTNAWRDVSSLHGEWSLLTRELQDVDIQTAREAGVEFLTLDWGSLFIRLYNIPDDIIAEQLRQKSTSEVLDAAISNLMVAVHYFDVAVDLYEAAWEVLNLSIFTHHGEINHDGVYAISHTVPLWINWTCDRNFPKFKCWGADDCEKEFYTTYDAKSQDLRVCGQETSPAGYDQVQGCGDEYYICDEVEAEEHKVWFCVKWFWENNKRKERCGHPYRYCTNMKRDHRNAFWSLATKHEHRAEEVRDYFAQVGTSDNDPDDPDGIHTNTDDSPNCNACTTGNCPECPEIYSTDGSNLAIPGDLTESRYTGDKPFSHLYWYVKTPGDTSDLGTQVEIDIGGSATYETDLIYRIPQNAPTGTYKITAYVYPYDGSAVYWISYYITVW